MQYRNKEGRFSSKAISPQMKVWLIGVIPSQKTKKLKRVGNSEPFRGIYSFALFPFLSHTRTCTISLSLPLSLSAPLLSIYLSIYLSICPSIHLSIHLSIFLALYLSFSLAVNECETKQLQGMEGKFSR
jgi:hypothetical protein